MTPGSRLSRLPEAFSPQGGPAEDIASWVPENWRDGDATPVTEGTQWAVHGDSAAVPGQLCADGCEDFADLIAPLRPAAWCGDGLPREGEFCARGPTQEPLCAVGLVCGGAGRCVLPSPGVTTSARSPRDLGPGSAYGLEDLAAGYDFDGRARQVGGLPGAFAYDGGVCTGP